MKKVVKFGGSSLASAEQFKKVGDIIRADKSRRYVVPSAPGKRSSSDTKVTDMLYSCYNLAIREKKFTSLLSEIQARYNEIIDGLELDLSLDHEFDVIRENFGKKIGRDYAASRGEYLNSIIMANYLGFRLSMLQTSFALMKTAIWMMRKQMNCLHFGWKEKNLLSSLGFMVQKRMERSLVSLVEVLISQVLWLPVQSWLISMKTGRTCPDLIADPRIVKNPKSIETITYRELRELSYMGATVLMKMRFSLFARLEFQSISAIPMRRRIKELSSWKALADSQNIRLPELPEPMDLLP